MNGTSRSAAQKAFTGLFRRVRGGPAGDDCAIEFGGGENHLVWKHPGKDFACGTCLLVQEGQEAVLFADGSALDRLGKGRYALDGPVVPPAERFFHGGLRPGAVYSSRIYFVNTAEQLGIQWGLPDFVRLTDIYTRLPVSLGGRGTFDLRVKDSRRLVLRVAGAGTELLRSRIFGEGMDAGEGLFRGMILSRIRYALAELVRDRMIDLADLTPWYPVFSDGIRKAINSSMQDYGLEITGFHFKDLFLDRSDPNTALIQGRHSGSYMNGVHESQRKKKIEDAAAEGEAKARRSEWTAKAEAEHIRQVGRAEVEMREAGGYSYAQETERLVSLEAAKHISPGCPWWEWHRYEGSWSYSDGWHYGGSRPCGDRGSAPGGRASGAGASGSWYCPNCRTRQRSRYCPECGTKRPETQDRPGTI